MQIIPQDLNDLRVFAHLAAAGSFTGAARSLGVTKQTVSRRVAVLEESLGVELVRRSTRRVTLTELGQAYAQRCAAVTRLAEEASRAVASEGQVVAGRLRLTADPTLGALLLRATLARYCADHPQVQVELELTARKVDLLEEGFDLAFRVGMPPEAAHLSARLLAPARLLCVASPDYLRARGAPRDPSELAEHDCLSALPAHSPAAWPMQVEGALRRVPIAARLRVNDPDTARAMALEGLGLALLPSLLVAEDLRAGRLREVLAPHAPEVGGIYAITPDSALLSPKVTALLELAEAEAARALRAPADEAAQRR
ncbi:MAG: LysR family transcriptional regulator [Alphaproteobacteria bacterium]|nr:LysR family transcriptional regulator [Alphaproteobacteria bacterium]